MTTDKINVTDHCVVRYLERVLNLDVEGVRDRIRDECRNAIDAGATSLKMESYQYQFAREGKTVVTVTPSNNTVNLTSRKITQARMQAVRVE
jgi:hypothetical protein